MTSTGKIKIEKKGNKRKNRKKITHNEKLIHSYVWQEGRKG